ncbi:MAG: ubiquinone/menaquinone biosynthesis methyltransferase [Gemmatimonadota bacterium]
MSQPDPAYDREEITRRKRGVQAMFNAIARRYDLLNHVLSAGVDVYWRRRALSLVRLPRPRRVLDLATGTGDFAAAAGRLEPERVVGVDVALEMLRRGKGKVAGLPVPTRLLAGDGEQLPFRDGCFDLVTAAFGVRNFGHIPTGLAEAFRVLTPGGELVVLDFAEPRLPVFAPLYRFYFRRVLPRLGGLISGQRRAYAYLPASVGTFPQGRAFLDLLERAGFSQTRATSLSLGIAAVYQGLRPGAGR